jgi:WD40 repeat protein
LKIETLRLKEIQTINLNASYSPDGKWVAVVGNNGQILIYDALTGDVMYEYFGYDILFNPQNSGQILTFDDTNLYIWKALVHEDLTKEA